MPSCLKSQLERRLFVHFSLTDAPSARWTGQQLVNAFPYDSAPKHLIRDRDEIYGADFVRRVRAMEIEQVTLGIIAAQISRRTTF
ncbi:MAG: hypothetical protein WCE62_14925 [Polyangiales bacterium]